MPYLCIMGLRQEKFGKQVLRDLSELLNLHRAEWLGSAFVTISDVQVSPDLGLVKVYVSLYNNPNRQQILDQLDLHNKDIRHELARRIRNNVKKIPEIRFYEDNGLDYAAKMDEVFARIKRDESSDS